MEGGKNSVLLGGFWGPLTWGVSVGKKGCLDRGPLGNLGGEPSCIIHLHTGENAGGRAGVLVYWCTCDKGLVYL